MSLNRSGNLSHFKKDPGKKTSADVENLPKRYTLRDNFLTAMQVPSDLACKAPVITITGPVQAVIENYKSILLYTSEKLILLTCRGKVILQGKNLEITSYTFSEMEVHGYISSVFFERG